MPANGTQDTEDRQQWKLPHSSLFLMSGHLSWLMVEQHLLSDVWERHTGGSWSACTCSLMLSWASRPFTAHPCAIRWTVHCHEHMQVCADLLQLFKGLVLSSRSGCFYRGVDVFVCVPVWQQCVGLGFLLDCSQNLRGRVCPRCHIQNFSGVRAELNLICFVFCRVFSY